MDNDFGVEIITLTAIPAGLPDIYELHVGGCSVSTSEVRKFIEYRAAAICKAIDEAVEIERKRCQKWLDVGQNEMDRAYNGIAEGRNWRDG